VLPKQNKEAAVGKDENPAKPCRGYAHTDGRKERREAQGGLARPSSQPHTLRQVEPTLRP
jgi:hypothetical protein